MLDFRLLSGSWAKSAGEIQDARLVALLKMV
jgi:hypothetical protein